MRFIDGIDRLEPRENTRGKVLAREGGSGFVGHIGQNRVVCALGDCRQRRLTKQELVVLADAGPRPSTGRQ